MVHVKHDHCYTHERSDANDIEEKESVVPPHLTDVLYRSHVVLNLEQRKDLEAATRLQSDSELWFNARKLRITASIMKEMCHRKSTTTCEAFIRKKLYPSQINTAAISYGKQHEKDAISLYVQYQRSQGVNVLVTKCGLIVDEFESWLAASPDGIVTDPSQNEHKTGCLEVKCPYVCGKMTITDACRKVSAFCLVEQKGVMCLSELHTYFYQIQTQMHVGIFKWSDFVVWSPKQVFVQRIWYNAVFMMKALQIAKLFYFEKFLPAAIPYMIIKPSVKQACQVMVQDAINMDKPAPSKIVLPPCKLLPCPSKLSSQNSTSDPGKCSTTGDVQILGSTKTNSLSLQAALQCMDVKQHVVKGDGNCLYHSIAHQAGLISRVSDGDGGICQRLRKVAQSIMWKYPDVRKESGLTVVQWLQKCQEIPLTTTWGGDIELRLLAIGMQRDIVVLTATSDQTCTFARKFVCTPPPVMPKMRGGIFIPLTTDELCNQWSTVNPQPLLIIYNGQNHYNSTVCD